MVQLISEIFVGFIIVLMTYYAFMAFYPLFKNKINQIINFIKNKLKRNEKVKSNHDDVDGDDSTVSTGEV
jgi:hypothetical protein